MSLHHIAIICSSEDSIDFYKRLGFKEFFRKTRSYDTIAVSVRLYMMALALAPLSDSVITKFLRPMVKGLIACSAYYAHIYE